MLHGHRQFYYLYFYLMYDGNTNKNAKGTKKCVTKRRLKFNDYKNCLLNSEIIKITTKN